MSAKGYIKLNRQILENWIWQEKPFSRGQAWIDLLLLANYKDGKEMYRGKLLDRRRGCVYCSTLWLADRWGWSRGKVRRFLNALKADGMLTENGTTDGTTLTIENYTKFQGSRPTNSTTNGTTGSTTDGTTDGHTKEKKRIVKKGKNPRGERNDVLELLREELEEGGT